MAKVETKKQTVKKTAPKKATTSKVTKAKAAPKKVESKKSTPAKTTTSKATPKKATSKKVVKPKLVETPKVEETVIEKPILKAEVSNANKTECRFCHEHFETSLTICPFCRKRQKDKTGIIVIAILSVILLICIVANHFIEKYYEDSVSESDYKFSCNLASYEQLVRSPKELKNTNVKVIGKVISVDGSDFDYGNLMIVKMDANLFDGATAQIVEFEYLDSNYSIGFLEGDIITIYGKYHSINGNTPFIKAKYVVFGT